MLRLHLPACLHILSHGPHFPCLAHATGAGWQPSTQHAAAGGSGSWPGGTAAGGNKGGGGSGNKGGGGGKRGSSKPGAARGYGPEDQLERLDPGIDLEQEESPLASEFGGWRLGLLG